MKLRALLLAGLCVVGGQARAGLFNDDEAREQVRQVEARVLKLEESSKQQAATNRQQADTNKQQADASRQQADINKQQDDTNKQQTRSMLDLQAQIEAQNTELRMLHGLNEELVHGLQDAEKRQKDFYIDLDTRIRHFESVESAASAAPQKDIYNELDTRLRHLEKAAAGASPSPPSADVPAADDPSVENRAYEAAYKLFKAGKHQEAIEAFQEFLKKFPESVYVPNVYYEAGGAYLALKNYKSALTNYQLLASKYSFSPKAPDAMLSVADCQQELGDLLAVKKTLKQITAKYPGSEAANEARKRLAVLK